jgi:hypothetical protein
MSDEQGLRARIVELESELDEQLWLNRELAAMLSAKLATKPARPRGCRPPHRARRPREGEQR